jgi:hypothetical protein
MTHDAGNQIDMSFILSYLSASRGQNRYDILNYLSVEAQTSGNPVSKEKRKKGRGKKRGKD